MMSLGFALLLVSVFGLFVGPAVLSLGSGQRALLSAINAFVVVSVGGLVLFHLTPEAWIHGGAPAILFVLLGAVLPSLMERSLSKTSTALTPVLLLLGLMPHAALESTALGMADVDHALGIGAAVAAHRLPVGLVLFSIWRRSSGATAAWVALVALTLATVVGFWAGDFIESLVSESVMSWLQGFVGGALLHVVFTHHLSGDGEHQHSHEDADGQVVAGGVGSALKGLTRWSLLGGGVGVLVVALTVLMSPHH